METTTELQPARPPAPVRLWRQRNFLSLILGTGLSVLGDGAYFIVLGWFVLNITGSEFALGTTLTVASIPRIVFMLIGGAVADRVSRKKILVTSLLSRAVILFVFVALLSFLNHGTGLWIIDIMALLFGTIDAFFWPAGNSVIPSAVFEKDLAQANSLIQTVQQISTVLGPLLAAGLLWMGGYPLMFGTIAGIFALSAVMLMFLKLRGNQNSCSGQDYTESGGLWRDIWDGIRYVKSVPVLMIIMLLSLGVNLFFMGPINIGIPTLVKSLGWSGDVYGTYESGFGIGTVLGGLLVAWLKGLRGRFLWLGGFGVLMGLGMSGIGFVHAAWGGVALMGVMGMMVSAVDIPIFIYIQTIVPADKLGRTMSLLTLMSVGLVPVSYTMSSFVLQQQSVHVNQLLLVCGLIMAGLFASIYLSRSFRLLEDHPVWKAKGREEKATSGKTKGISSEKV